MRVIFVICLILYSLNGLADDQWLGKSPDCWTEARLFHSGSDDLVKNLRIDKVPLEDFDDKRYSPNKGYYFFITEPTSQQRTIYIYAEKNYLSKIDLVNVHAISDQKWINEKLLFLRVWWGRIAATDFIYDVEAEKFLYQEDLIDGRNAYQQYKESCKVHDICDCIKIPEET